MLGEKNRGITLVAMVITIVILLILAGISISNLTNTGLLSKTKEAKLEAKRSQVIEWLNLKLMEEQATTENKTEQQIIEATKENVEKSKEDLKKIGKVNSIEDVKTEEDGEKASPYFYVTLDNDVYKVENSSVKYVGEQGKFPPVIKNLKLTNTTNSVTVEVTTSRNNNGKYAYYIKGEKDKDYKLGKETKESTYKFEGLEQGIKYSVKVVVEAPNKKTAEKIAEITTGKVTDLKEGDIKFSVEPSTITNKDVTVTAELTVDIGNYTLKTSIDGKNWKEINTQTFSENGKMYAILTDGTNYGASASQAITNIDKTPPTAPTIVNSGDGKWTNQEIKITLSSSDLDSGVEKYQFKYSGTNNEWKDVENNPDTWRAERNETVYYRAVDKAGNISDTTATPIKIDKTAPTYTSAEIKNVTTSGYDVYVYGVKDTLSGVNRVQFPTWTKYNGQDDLQQNWDTNTAVKGTKQADGTTWVYHVNIANHNNEYGKYMTHIYFYDEFGNSAYVNPTDGEYTIVKDPNVKILFMEDKKASINNDYTVINNFKKYFTNVTYNESMTADQMIKSDYDLFIDYGAYWACAKQDEIRALYNAGKNLITVGNDNIPDYLDIIKDAVYVDGTYTAKKVTSNSISNALADELQESDGMRLIEFKDNVDKWYTTTKDGKTYDVVGCLTGSKKNRWIHSQFYALFNEEACDKQELVYYAIGKR